MAETTPPTAPTPAATNGGIKLHELAVIRDILMGEHIAEFSERITTLEEHLIAANEANDSRFKDLEARHAHDLDTLRRSSEERMLRIETHLREATERLDRKVAQVSTTDKATLGKMLGELAQKLGG